MTIRKDDPRYYTVPPKGLPGDSTDTATGELIPWVDTRFVFLKMTNIDTVNQSVFIKVRVFTHWTDQRMIAWEGPLPGSLWGPFFNFSNSLGNMQCKQDEFSLMDDKVGRLRRVHLYEGDLDNVMNLSDFPLDFDFIPLYFTTLSRWQSYDQSLAGKTPIGKSYRVRQCRPAEGRFMALDFDIQHIPEFTLTGISGQITELAPNEVGSERTQINVGFHVARRTAFYFWKVLGPLYIITFLSFTVYIYPPRDLRSRGSITATYFLAAFAMLYVLQGTLPKTDFLTKVDQIVVLVSIQLAGAGLATAVLYNIAISGDPPMEDLDSDGVYDQRISVSTWFETERDDAARALNYTFLVLAICLFVAQNVLVFMPPLGRKADALRRLSKDYPKESKNPLYGDDDGDFPLQLATQFDGKPPPSVRHGFTYWSVKTITNEIKKDKAKGLGSSGGQIHDLSSEEEEEPEPFEAESSDAIKQGDN
jgi:hypothetical protein